MEDLVAFLQRRRPGFAARVIPDNAKRIDQLAAEIPGEDGGSMLTTKELFTTDGITLPDLPEEDMGREKLPSLKEILEDR